METPLRALKGDFQHYSICGPYEHSADDLLDLRSYHGLHPEGLLIYGTLRGASGTMYSLARRLPHGAPKTPAGEGGGKRKNMGSRILFQTNRNDPHLRFDIEVMKAAGSNEDFRAERVSDGARFCNGPDPRGNAWSYVVGTDHVEWHEQGLLDLRGTLIKPSIQWLLVDRDDGIMHTSIMSEARGTMCGEAVRGFVFVEQNYMAEGGRLYVSRDPLIGQQVEQCWFSWGTRWDDGTVEVGHFLAGNDRAGFAIAGNGQRLILQTSDVEAVVTRDEGGYWHNGILLNAAGEQWEMVPSMTGRQIDMANMPNPQQEGLVRRVGEKRAPVVWFAWGETAPSHGNRKVDRYRYG